jgi:hypothetical protein
MLTAATAEISRFATDEGGLVEADWLLIVGILGSALSLSSFFGYNIGNIVSQAFDDVVLGALRRAGV